MSRAAELLRTTPQCVLSITSLTVLIYLWQIIFANQMQINKLTICSRDIIFKHQFYRMLTSPFLHGSMFHIGTNMMSYMTLGSFLEKAFGTMWHYSTVFASVLLVSSTYVLVSFTLYFFGMKDIINTHALGFSGVLFHLLVIHCRLNSSTTHSVFGMFNVSSNVYPWVLLVLIQVFFPNISFLGHLSGIITGQLHTSGVFNCILPSPQRLRMLDENIIVRRFTSNHENYIKTPFSDDVFDTAFSSTESLSMNQIMIYGGKLWKFIKDVGETIKVIIFGRGNAMNQNIRLNDGDLSSPLVGLGNVNNIGEENEWNGLPTPIPVVEDTSSEYV